MYEKNLYITNYTELENGLDLRRMVHYAEEYPEKIKIVDKKILVTAWISDTEGRMIAHS